MADTRNKRGLGSNKMDPKKKLEIQRKGGQSSHSGGRKSKTSDQNSM